MSTSEEIIALYKQYVMPTYAPGLVLVKGKGAKVWDADGKVYLDFLAGIAVLSVGHCHPKVVKAIQTAGREADARLEPLLQREPAAAGGDAVHAVAGRQVLLLQLRRGGQRGPDQAGAALGPRPGQVRDHHHDELVPRPDAGHAAATGQTKYQKGFEPMPEGFVYAEFNDLDSVRAAINDKTAAVLVEAVQGEGGIVPAKPEFMKGLRALCDEKDLLLLCDEVQCGMGRTGHWFGFQAYGIQPDAFSLAKGLGSGFPIGAVVAAPKLADVFQPGNHASTFGGTPLACAAALATIDVIEQEKLARERREDGRALPAEAARSWRRNIPSSRTCGASGLMVGLVCDRPAKPLEVILRDKGLISIATPDTVIRFLPPLNVKASQIRKAAKIVDEACAQWQATSPQPQSSS